MSEPEKLGDVSARLLKWATENAEELDRRSAEYDQRQAELREREKSSSTLYAERVRGLPLAQHPGVAPRPWPTHGYIHGPVGSGKTRLAVEHALSISRDECVFVAFVDYVDLARQVDLDQASGFERDRYDAAFRRRYLVLDDLGARRPTPAAIDYTFKLVGAREDLTRFRTLVTSNYTLEELAPEWDDRIASRIRGFGPPFLMDGPDWRFRDVRRSETRFLRFPQRTHDSDESADETNSQAAILSDLEPGRPRGGA